MQLTAFCPCLNQTAFPVRAGVDSADASGAFHTKNSNDTHSQSLFSDNEVCMISISLVADWPGTADTHAPYSGH